MKKQADILYKSISGFIARQLAPMRETLDGFAETLRALPKPKDGENGKDGRDAPTLDEVVDAVLPKVKTPTADEVAAVVLEKIEVPKPKDGENGKDGRDAPTLDEVVDAVLPKVKDGENGKDGRDAPTLDEVVDAVLPKVKTPTADEVAAVVLEKIEVPKPKDGENGKDGRDAPTLDEVVAEVLPKLEALKPKDGENGKDGRDAPTLDEVAAVVLEKMPKPEPGIRGREGERGRDAAHLEILPAIDTEKEYPRGTYARHKNGLWRSFEDTQEMRGWECIVAGVASLDLTFDGERKFSLASTLSDGEVVHKTFNTCAMIYRGLFNPDREGGYEKGDVVTWASHTWHCNEPTSESPIEGGTKWTLQVRRGRDGKSAK